MMIGLVAAFIMGAAYGMFLMVAGRFMSDRLVRQRDDDIPDGW